MGEMRNPIGICWNIFTVSGAFPLRKPYTIESRRSSEPPGAPSGKALLQTKFPVWRGTILFSVHELLISAMEAAGSGFIREQSGSAKTRHLLCVSISPGEALFLRIFIRAGAVPRRQQAGWGRPHLRGGRKISWNQSGIAQMRMRKEKKRPEKMPPSSLSMLENAGKAAPPYPSGSSAFSGRETPPRSRKCVHAPE